MMYGIGTISDIEKPVWILLLLGVGLALASCTPKKDVKTESLFLAAPQKEVKKLPPELSVLQKGELRRRFVTFNFGYFKTNVQKRFQDKKEAVVVNLTLFEDVSVAIKTTSITKKDDNVYVWKGKLKAKNYGRVSLSLNEHTAFGVIQVDSKLYEIKPIRNSIVAITEIDQRKLPEEGPPIVPKKKRIERRGVTKKEARPDVKHRTILKVLIVLPEPSYSIFCGKLFPFPFDLLQLISSNVEDNLNDVFNAINSTGISASVDTVCYDYTPQGGSLSGDLSWLKNDAAIANLRDNYRSDLVSLIVPSGDYCGRGYINFPVTAADEEYAFTVVLGNCALGKFSLAHELGHNMGMRHDRTADNAFASSDCNYGYVFPIDVFFLDFDARTVMAYGSSCGDCTRMGLYSNPTKIDFGLVSIGPMGVSCSTAGSGGNYTKANNRQQLIDAAPTVSNFR